MDVEIPPSNNRTGELEKTKVQIQGMFLDKSNGYLYKVKEDGKTELLTRDEMLEKDPIAMVLFYEANLKITKRTTRQ
jgi:hypothetical protein